MVKKEDKEKETPIESLTFRSVANDRHSLSFHNTMNYEEVSCFSIYVVIKFFCLQS